jgi:hypothetical protein
MQVEYRNSDSILQYIVVRMSEQSWSLIIRVLGRVHLLTALSLGINEVPGLNFKTITAFQALEDEEEALLPSVLLTSFKNILQGFP